MNTNLVILAGLILPIGSIIVPTIIAFVREGKRS